MGMRARGYLPILGRSVPDFIQKESHFGLLNFRVIPNFAGGSHENMAGWLLAYGQYGVVYDQDDEYYKK